MDIYGETYVFMGFDPQEQGAERSLETIMKDSYT